MRINKKKIIEKNRIFDALLEGKEILIDNDNQRFYFNRYNDIMLCREFKWSEQQLLNTSKDFYNDAILLLQKEAFLNKSRK